MQTLSIEPGTANDCYECAQLLVEHLRELGVDASAKALARVSEDVANDPARGFILVARENGRVVGLAYVATILSMEHCGPVAWIEELYVSPDHRQRGIGTALMTEVLKRAREAGIVAIDLEVDARQSRAIAFYQRIGFRSLDRSRWVKELTD
jgi:ribosomal protein S18 acetylase RimI-like enzyme